MTAVTKNAMPPSNAKKKARASSRPPESNDAADAGNGKNDRHDTEDGEDATKGDWLFKQDDLVLGPVTSIVLVDKLKKGELGGDTPIARDGAAFRPMKVVRLFREAWQAAEEEKRFAAEQRAHQSAVSRTRFLRVVVVLLLIAVPAAGAAFGARSLMIARPWDDRAAWIARVPPMVDLPQKPAEVKTTTTPATVVAAGDPVAEEDDEDEKPGVVRDPNRPKRPKKVPGTATTTTTTTAATTAAATTTPEPEPARNTAGLPGELTNAQAVAPLKEIQSDLKGCFKAEMDSNADMPGAVVLSYTITEDGKAINVDLDARELRGRPVVGCVQKAMGTVRWPKFNGERKNVSVPFKLGKPKPTPKP